MEFENLLKLINTVSDSKLTDFEYEENGTRVVLAKKQEKVQIVSDNTQRAAVEVVNSVGTESNVQAVAAPTGDVEGNIVKSPLVGTFYAAPAEDAESFVKIGDVIKKNQTLAIIEAMKLMNEIESEFDGKIVEIYVENSQAVEYGQPLFRVQ